MEKVDYVEFKKQVDEVNDLKGQIKKYTQKDVDEQVKSALAAMREESNEEIESAKFESEELKKEFAHLYDENGSLIDYKSLYEAEKKELEKLTEELGSLQKERKEKERHKLLIDRMIYPGGFSVDRAEEVVDYLKMRITDESDKYTIDKEISRLKLDFGAQVTKKKSTSIFK